MTQKLEAISKPEIFGEFSNWKPKKMFEIEDLVSLVLTDDHQEIVTLMHEKRLLKNV